MKQERALPKFLIPSIKQKKLVFDSRLNKKMLEIIHGTFLYAWARIRMFRLALKVNCWLMSLNLLPFDRNIRQRAIFHYRFVCKSGNVRITIFQDFDWFERSAFFSPPRDFTPARTSGRGQRSGVSGLTSVPRHIFASAIFVSAVEQQNSRTGSRSFA